MYSEIWEGQILLKKTYTKCVNLVCKKYELTRIEFDIIMFLANNHEFDTAADIINKKHISKSHVSTAVNSMVNKGLITRTYTKDNRKSVHLIINDSACDIIREGKRAQKKYVKILFEGLSDDDKKYIIKLFKKIIQNAYSYLEEAIK